MTLTPPPAAVDLRPLADEVGVALQGNASLGQLPRVLADAPPDFDSSAMPAVVWQADAEWRQPLAADLGGIPKTFVAKSPAGFPPGQQLWLHLQVGSQVPRVCQRCLKSYLQPVSVDRWFRFVLDEAQALQEDDDVPEDLLVWTPKFNLFELIEDEVLLDLPLIPKHDVCTHTWQAEAMQAQEVVAQRPNPFAMLAQLKGDDGAQLRVKKGGA